MWRLGALALILCGGCASSNGYIFEDGMWGDLSTRLSPSKRYAPTSPVSSPAFYPDMVTQNAPPAQAPAAPSGQ